MPTYEYKCEKCRKSFDCYQSMKDDALTVCPKELCRQKTWGKGRVKRQLGTGAGLIFKGSGFYITDYRSEGYKAAAKSESTAKSESSGGESKAGDTKKPESKPAPAEKTETHGEKEEGVAMPPNPSPSANLPCEQCAYLNEPERVYCHNCGAKLDRSLLPKGEEAKQEAPEKARKRIAKMTNPQSGWFWREVKALFKVGFGSAVIAAVVLIARAPDDVPDPKKPGTMRLVSGDMMEAMESPTPRAISFTEDEVNEHLKRMLKAREGVIPGVEFTRAFVLLRPGVIRIGSENSVWGFPVYSGVGYHLEVKDGKFLATVVGGNFGRLAIDPRLMVYADPAFQGLWTSLQRERKQMDKMASVKVEDKHIDLVTKGATAAAP